MWVNVPNSQALATFLHKNIGVNIGVTEGIRQTETFVSLETRDRFAARGITGPA
jgi:hypothetical protein